MRLALLMFLAVTALMADGLWRARPQREVVVRGLIRSQHPLERPPLVEMELRFNKIRRRLSPDGKQWLAMPAEAAQDTWNPAPAEAPPEIEWQGQGRYVLRLRLTGKEFPDTLTLRFLESGRTLAQTRPCRLRTRDAEKLLWEAWPAPVSLTMTSGSAGPPPPLAERSRPAKASAQEFEPQELDISQGGVAFSEETLIGERAEIAVREINRLSTRNLEACLLWIRSCQRRAQLQGVAPNPRLQAIGLLVEQVLRRKTGLHAVLVKGDRSRVEEVSGYTELPLESPTLAED